MDNFFDEILDTILENNEENTLFIQLCFYCFRSFIEDRILDESLELDWNNLQELCEKYCDEEWKPYINDFFNPEISFEDEELLETFFRNFIQSFDILVKSEDVESQDKFTEFLDNKLFKLFNDSIFPSNCEEKLNLEKYLDLRKKQKEQEPKEQKQEPKEQEQEQEPKEQEQEQEENSSTYIIKRKNFNKLKGTPIKNKIIFSKTRKNKNVSI
jgi:hypothetical protein